MLVLRLHNRDVIKGKLEVDRRALTHIVDIQVDEYARVVVLDRDRLRVLDLHPTRACSANVLGLAADLIPDSNGCCEIKTFIGIIGQKSLEWTPARHRNAKISEAGT
jgi:hypothetical protein